MPTLKNIETGETKEMSIDELMKAMREGNVSIRQEITKADGTVTSSTVYGNNFGDNVDYSVNIFVDMDTYSAFAIRAVKILVGEIEEPADDNDDENNLYEMTIDFTDIAAMGIVKSSKGNLSVDLYTRDETKSCSDYLRVLSKTWEKDASGDHLAFDLEDLRNENKDISLYMLAFLEIRRFLKKSGKLDELEKLANRGSGVIVRATGDAEDADATIVQGKERPDLPCNMFLLGEQMLRPYIDEMISTSMLDDMTFKEKLEAAENGDEDAMDAVAMAYLNGDEEENIEANPEKAVEWFARLAERDNPSAQFNLGLHYAKGYGVKRNFDQAVKWMQKAADNGDTDAPILIEKYSKAAKATKKIAKGDAQAQADLAEVLMSLAGSLEQAGTGNDYKEAFELAKKSAAQNNPDGLWILALAYEHGRGTRKNVKKAIECYQKGAELGHAPSQHSLACYYLHGDKLKQDDKKAFELFLKSAEQGHGLAMADVGRCYQFATGVDHDMKKAIEWYEKALEVIDDPELEQKTAIFKMLEENENKNEKSSLVTESDQPDAAVDLDSTIGDAKDIFKLLDEAAARSMAASGGEFPYAEPKEGQHTHLGFQDNTKSMLSMLGALQVNQTGTEYSFLSLADIADTTDNSEYSNILSEIVEADTGDFDLVETAHDMAELFRVNVESFNMGEDREQDILNGYIRRVLQYNKFRSFAWTFAAYCDKNNLKPEAVDFATIQDMVDYIESLKCLNYTADSFSPTICSGDDLHVYYIPDSVSKKTRNKLLKVEKPEDGDDSQLQTEEIQSLDGLRKELSYMYPAIRAIYDALEVDRDRDEALEGGAADILYAWCSMTYAAREPIFSEDGPVNCWWEHPDNETVGRKKFKIDMLEQEIKQGEKWMKQHKRELSKAKITVQGKTFVFNGVETMDEWDDILKKLTELGGIRRTAVSGKTDYVVCNPGTASDSKLSKAKEQNAKGNNVKIVLLADFLKAIKMEISSPEKKIAQLKGENSKPKEPTEKHLKPVERPSASGSTAKDEEISPFTYEKGLKAKGDGYEIDIPDGFVIKEGEEGRDFIAYIPNEEDPDSHMASSFVIFAGKKLDSTNISGLETVAEFGFLGCLMYAHLKNMYKSTDSVRYGRRDLPGIIMYDFELGSLHSHVSVGVDEHMQMMRFQINGVNRRNLETYEKKVVELMDHMRADKPVKLLKELDDKSFLKMSTSARGKVVTEWTALLGNYMQRIRKVCNLDMQYLVKEFEQSDNGNIAKLKKDIKVVLARTISSVDEALLTAEAVYTLKRAESSDSPGVEKMKVTFEEVLAGAGKAEVNLNDEHHIEVVSEVASEITARLSAPVDEAINQITGDGCTLKEDTKAALLKIREEKAEQFEAERIAKEKAEAERIAKEKAEAEKKKMEEEAEKKKKYDSAMALAMNPHADNIKSAKRILTRLGRKKYSGEIEWCDERLRLIDEKKKLEKDLKKETLKYKIEHSEQIKELDAQKKQKLLELEPIKKDMTLEFSLARTLLLALGIVGLGVLSLIMALDDDSFFMGGIGLFLSFVGVWLIYIAIKTQGDKTKMKKQLKEGEQFLEKVEEKLNALKLEIEKQYDDKNYNQIKAQIEEIETKLKAEYQEEE